MEIHGLTIGLPVQDLSRAVAWYRRALDLPEPELEPAPGVVEFRLGPIWLQLVETDTARSGAQVTTRIGVADAVEQRARLAAHNIAVGPLECVPGVVSYFDFADPDGNQLSIYSEG